MCSKHSCHWLKRSEFERRKGAGNKRSMKAIVRSGEVPGILAYDGETTVGWCAVGPRESYPVLDRSRILKPVDDKAVWSVVCFFIRKEYRDRGFSVRLLKAAADHVRRMGGTILEGYPTEPRKGRMAAAFAWTGLASAFRKAGFREVARRSDTRPIMRFHIPRPKR